MPLQVTEYTTAKNHYKNVWDRYPLKLNGGSFLVVDALAGQEIEATFRPVKSTSSGGFDYIGAIDEASTASAATPPCFAP